MWSSSRFAAHHPINLKSHCRHYATLTLVSFHANSTNYVLSSFRCSSWRNNWFSAYRGLVNMVFKAQVSPKAKHKLVVNPGKQAITARPFSVFTVSLFCNSFWKLLLCSLATQRWASFFVMLIVWNMYLLQINIFTSRLRHGLQKGGMEIFLGRLAFFGIFIIFRASRIFGIFRIY